MHECQIPAKVSLAKGSPKIEVLHHNEGSTAVACRYTEKELLFHSTAGKAFCWCRCKSAIWEERSSCINKKGVVATACSHKGAHIARRHSMNSRGSHTANCSFWVGGLLWLSAAARQVRYHTLV